MAYLHTQLIYVLGTLQRNRISSRKLPVEMQNQGDAVCSSILWDWYFHSLLERLKTVKHGLAINWHKAIQIQCRSNTRTLSSCWEVQKKKVHGRCGSYKYGFIIRRKTYHPLGITNGPWYGKCEVAEVLMKSGTMLQRKRSNSENQISAKWARPNGLK